MNFRKIFEDLIKMTSLTMIAYIYDQAEINIKGKDLRLMLVTFWKLFALKYSLEKNSFHWTLESHPTAWGSKNEIIISANKKDKNQTYK